MRIHQIDEKYGSGHIENLAHEIRQKSEQLSDECLDNSFVVTEGQPRNIVHVKEYDFKLYYSTNTRPIQDPKNLRLGSTVRLLGEIASKPYLLEILIDVETSLMIWKHDNQLTYETTAFTSKHYFQLTKIVIKFAIQLIFQIVFFFRTGNESSML